MKFNWINAKELCIKEMGKIVDLEYAYRKKITQVLLLNNLIDCCEDTRCYAFDIDAATGKLTVSSHTPEPYYSILTEKISAL